MRATSLISGDLIVTNLTAQRPDGSRLSLGHTFNSTGQQVNSVGQPQGGRQLNLSGGFGAEPTFDTPRYTQLLKENKKLEADQLSVAYKQAIDQWRTGGGATLQDRIANAVLAFYKAEANVSTEDHDGPVIKPEQIVVKPVERANSYDAGVFVVMLSPTWGSR